ncbi:MAG: hypothetical protein Q9167_007157, partial [Letrouitia subvulpina]
MLLLTVRPYFIKKRPFSICLPPIRALGSLHRELHLIQQTRNIHIAPDHSNNIFVDDLYATLEAHRATNRAAIIRKVDSPGHPETIPSETQTHAEDNKELVSSPDIHKFLSSKGEAKKLEPWEFWPPHSAQYAFFRPEGRKKIPSNSVLEYIPASFGPTKEWQASTFDGSSDFELPWLRHIQTRTGDGFQRLASEIEAFERYMELSSDEKKASESVIAQVKKIVADILPDSTVQIVGSHRNGLAGPFSDIDFALMMPQLEKPPMTRGPSATNVRNRRIRRRALHLILGDLSRSPLFHSAEYIDARIPIVRAYHVSTGHEIQIQTLPTLGPNFTLSYLSEFPTLRPLYILLSTFLEQRSFKATFRGGLGSYVIFILIVNALKQIHGGYARDDVAKHLLYILDFYATSDLYKYGFVVDPPRIFPKDQKALSAEEKMMLPTDPVMSSFYKMQPLNPRQPYLLCLQNPANPAEDVGTKAYSIKHIQKTFAKARNALLKDLESWENGTEQQRQEMKGGLLYPLIGADYSRFEAKRKKVEGAGRPQPGAGRQGNISSSGNCHLQSAQRPMKMEMEMEEGKLQEKERLGNERQEKENLGSEREPKPKKVCRFRTEQIEAHADGTPEPRGQPQGEKKYTVSEMLEIMEQYEEKRKKSDNKRATSTEA